MAHPEGLSRSGSRSVDAAGGHAKPWRHAPSALERALMPRRAAAVLTGIIALVAPVVVLSTPSSAAGSGATAHRRTTCQVLHFDTDEHRFRPGFDNQGVAFIEASDPSVGIN